MIAVLHFLIHIFGIDYTLPYGHWGWYDFWSGVAGSFLVGLSVYGGSRWAHGTCHQPMCFRRGKHEAAGGAFKLCWKHHPDIGQKPHAELIERLHREWQRESR